MAGGSAVLTLIILAAFAGIVGVLTDRQVVSQFNTQVASQADRLQHQLGHLHLNIRTFALDCNHNVSLSDFASAEHAQVRIYNVDDGALSCTQDNVVVRGAKLPPVSPAFPAPQHLGTFTELSYRVAVRPLTVEPEGEYLLLYALPLSDVDRTLARVRVFLLLGVLGGSVLALLAGLATAQRAMRPIVELTEAAREVERTRDPTRRLPHPRAEDEVAELARTLEGMLAALDSARRETEAMLERQREFVADASHELRTPLTSVLANLELLAEELRGEQAESAVAALRSTRRMRRLVGDLLLLARADAKREATLHPTDLATVVTEAAAELEPVAEDHEISIDVTRAVVPGIRDDLHRLVLNLLENAIRHTPVGTRIRASTRTEGGVVVLVIEDDGPGIPEQIAGRVFERFVRGGGDGGRGSGLGLAIVHAVTKRHGGTLSVSAPEQGSGTRFEIALPTAAAVPVPAIGGPASLPTRTGQ
ncbi:MAG: sensor histidine kinase [Solirubrobacteraceae bacterium]